MLLAPVAILIAWNELDEGLLALLLAETFYSRVTDLQPSSAGPPPPTSRAGPRPRELEHIGGRKFPFKRQRIRQYS